MKKAALVFGMIALASNVIAADIKIAIVDMSKVFSEYYKTKDAEVTLKERMASFQKERQDMLTDYQKMTDETSKLRDQANDKTLSEAARKEKQSAFEQKVGDLRGMERKVREFEAQRTRAFDDQSRRMRLGIVDEINKEIQSIGQKEKYNLIIDKSGQSMNGTPTLLYSQDLKDITDDVIKTINANKPAGSPAAAPSAPAAPAKK